MTTSWIQNIPFYYILQNFSLFYVCSIVISVSAVFLTWYLTNTRQVYQPKHECKDLRREPLSTSNKDVHTYEFHVMSQVKRAKQKAIEKILTEQLSKEQLQQEKEIENKQLTEIFQLLQAQEEKFQINSKEELHEQLKLYKNQ